MNFHPRQVQGGGKNTELNSNIHQKKKEKSNFMCLFASLGESLDY